MTLHPAARWFSADDCRLEDFRAQTAHRDHHLGFMSAEQAARYPSHTRLLSPALTLQGAVAHGGMPVGSGPTMFLPHSQKYAPGHLAVHREEFAGYFAEHHVQLPLRKGDAVFFNPALFHGAGHNRSEGIRGEQVCSPDLEDGLAASVLAEAATRSAVEGRRVQVAEITAVFAAGRTAGIAVTGRNAEAARDTLAQLRELGADAEFVGAVLADAEQAASVVPRTVERFGWVDAVVNAAGLTTRGTMLDTTTELFDQHLAVNLRAPFLIMSAAIRHLRGRGDPGTVVNVISLSAHGGQPYLAP